MKPRMRFEDGSVERFDAIVYATGYRTTFPFIDRTLFEIRDGEATLYRRMLPPDRPGLYFAGLVQPIGPTIPLVEIQGRWIAGAIAGTMALPDRETMQREIVRNREALARRYLDSPRYTLEVDFRDYARQLRGDMERGRAAA